MLKILLNIFENLDIFKW